MNKNHMLTIASLFIFMAATISLNTTVTEPGTLKTKSSDKTKESKNMQLSQQIKENKTLNRLEFEGTKNIKITENLTKW